jgi:hypothetical protein
MCLRLPSGMSGSWRVIRYRLAPLCFALWHDLPTVPPPRPKVSSPANANGDRRSTEWHGRETVPQRVDEEIPGRGSGLGGTPGVFDGRGDGRSTTRFGDSGACHPPDYLASDGPSVNTAQSCLMLRR